MTDAISLLKADHKKVKALFKEAGELTDRAFAARHKLFTQIDQELTLHAQVEEQIFYPALKSKSKPTSDAREEVLEAYEEHASVKELIAKLEALDPKDETYKPKLQVLAELVNHHVKEEESEMFKQARSLLSEDELVRLGEEMTAFKQSAMAVA